MMKRNDKPTSTAKQTGPKTPDDLNRLTAAYVGLDAVAYEFERRWGVGRLITLCRDNTRVSFRRGSLMLQEANAARDTNAAVSVIEGLKKLWGMMDAQATADGHQRLSDEVWEARLEDGRVFALCRTNAEATEALRSGRATVAYSMAEIARLLPRLDLLGAIKTEFPGAIVERVTPRSEGFAESWATSDPLHEILYEGSEV